jgi:Mg-chelatase subunit ChlD
MIKFPKVKTHSCDSVSPTPRLIIKPERALICLSNTLKFDAYLSSPSGERKLVSGVEFRSSNSHVLAINPVDGTSIALSVGTVKVTVRYQSQSAVAVVKIAEDCDEVVVGYQFAVDTSLSMSGELNASWPSKLEAAKEIISRLKANIRAADLVGLFSFSSYVNDDILAIDAPSAFTDEVLAQVVQGKSNATNLSAAIQDADANLSSVLPTQPVMVIFTDGSCHPRLDADSKAELLDITDEFKSAGGVIIICGLRAYGEGFDLLSQMASDGYFLNLFGDDTQIIDNAVDSLLAMLGLFCGKPTSNLELGYGYGFDCLPDVLGAQLPDSTPETDLETAVTPKYISTKDYCASCDEGQVNIGSLVPRMTGYTTPSGTVSASSENVGQNTLMLAWHAFDPHSEGWATSYGNTSGDLDYQFDTAQVVTAYRMTALSLTQVGGIEVDAPYTWLFQGSNNGVDWTTLDTQTALVWAPAQRRRFELDNSTAYAYYRLNISSANGVQHFVGIKLLELFGEIQDAVCRTATATSDISQDDADIKATAKAMNAAFASMNCLLPRLPDVTFSPASGDLAAGFMVTLSVADHPNARILFTVGTSPDDPSFENCVGLEFARSNAPFFLKSVGALMLKAVAREPGYMDSLVSTQHYS